MPANVPVFEKAPSALTTAYHPYIWDLIDMDGSQPKYVQRPTVRITLLRPVLDNTGAVTYPKAVAITLRTVDSYVRTNSLTQKSQSVDIVIHDVADWIHPNGFEPIHSMYGILIEEGYNGVMVETFTGYVVAADYSNFPSEIRLSCSDILYLTRRFFILSPLSYQSWYVEDAIRDLCGRCGIPSSQLNIGADGKQTLYVPPLPVTDTGKGKYGAILSYQTIEAAITHLLELYGFSIWCDVNGNIEIQYVRPAPASQPTFLPVQTPLNPGTHQWGLKLVSAQGAVIAYGDHGLPGNLLHVVSHQYASDDMRNFVGVFDGVNAPFYQSEPPAVIGYPPPVLPNPLPPRVLAGESSAEQDAATQAVTGTRNTSLMPYFTAAMMQASDLIFWNSLVLAHPEVPGSTTTVSMQEFIAARMLTDLNRETETAEVVTFGNPLLDVAQTIGIIDPVSRMSGNWLITGYQTRMSPAGYTSQLKVIKGPPLDVQYPIPKPGYKVTARHDGEHQVSIKQKQGHTKGGTGGTYFPPTATPGNGFP